jgi:hypothetical protein
MRAARWLRHEISTAPLTFGWLAILLGTTIAQHVLPDRELDQILRERSTNLHNLSTEPLKVLWLSLFWLDGAYWLPYLLIFSLLLAPAERWLGKVRWLLVGLAGHVVATYISEGLVAAAIHHNRASTSLTTARDVGVSYFMAAIAGIMVFHQARPWRWGYLTICLGYFALPAFVDTSYTTIGHCCALLLGIACYPLTHGRDRRQFDLFAVVRHHIGRRRLNRSPAPPAGAPAPPAGPSC